MKIIIGGVHVNNEHMIGEIAGIAGYKGSVKLIDECTRYIQIGSKEFRRKADVSDKELGDMITKFVRCGFIISSIEAQ